MSMASGQSQTIVFDEAMPDSAINTIPLTIDTLMFATTNIDSVIAFGKTFLHKPYRYKGESPWAMDCSGYIKYIFSQFGQVLPHSSGAIARVTEKVETSQVKKGDFLFFKGRNKKSKSIHHIAMVIEVDSSSIKMMHSSSSRGIIIENLDKSPYFKSRLIKAGRLPITPGKV